MTLNKRIKDIENDPKKSELIKQSRISNLLLSNRGKYSVTHKGDNREERRKKQKICYTHINGNNTTVGGIGTIKGYDKGCFGNQDIRNRLTKTVENKYKKVGKFKELKTLKIKISKQPVYKEAKHFTLSYKETLPLGQKTWTPVKK